MKRRDFIGLVGAAAAWPVVGRAQQFNPIRRVGALMIGSRESHAHFFAAFRQRLAELGFVEGSNLALDVQWANGRMDQLPALAAELIQHNPEVIMTSNTAGTIASTKSSTSIPLVFTTASDAVGAGLVSSYARPGGMATGIQINLDTLPGKQLNLLRELRPSVSRIGLLLNARNTSSALQKPHIEQDASLLGITLVPQEISIAADYEKAFANFLRENVQGVLVATDATFATEGRLIAEQAILARLPSLYSFSEQVEDGGLMSYGVNVSECFRHGADFVVKILSGARPADLPVELATKFDLVINLRTAKAIGLEIPPQIIALADEVIE